MIYLPLRKGQHAQNSFRYQPPEVHFRGWLAGSAMRACVRLIRTWLYCQRLCIADYQTYGRTAAAGGVWTFDIPHPPSFPGGTCRDSILPLCVGRRGTLTRGIYLLLTYSQLAANSSGFGERDWARVVECRSEIPRVSLYLVPWGGRIAAFCFFGAFFDQERPWYSLG